MATTKNISSLNIKKDNSTKEIVEVELNLHVVIEQRGKYWFAYNSDLRLYGKSKISSRNAEKDLGRAIDNFLSIHIERGSLERTLDNFSWFKKDDSFIGVKHTFSIKKLSSGLKPRQVNRFHEYAQLD